MEDTVELGGSIQLNGFGQVDGATMIILKKIVGNYAKQISERCSKFEKLSVSMDKSNGCRISAELLDSGNSITGEEENNNLFFALDKALKEIENKL